jgi:hypothetical protein
MGILVLKNGLVTEHQPNENHYNCLTSHSLHCRPSFFSTCFGSCKLLTQKLEYKLTRPIAGSK